MREAINFVVGEGDQVRKPIPEEVNPPNQSGADSRDKRAESLVEAADKIEHDGYDFHAKAHDQGEYQKIYHTSEHPRKLAERADQMAKALRLSPEQLALANMAIAWHDTVIEYDPPADKNNPVAMIRRHRGALEGDNPPYGATGNEGRSARLVKNKMLQADEIFTQEQIDTVVAAIEATYPDANFGSDFKGAPFKAYPYFEVATQQNPELGELLEELEKQGIDRGPLFSQPHLENRLENEEKKVPREVLIVALSDLGAAGLSEKGEFFEEGNAEMRELYANLTPETMRRLINDSDAAADREKVTAEFMKWVDMQIGFAAWQSLRFEKIIYLLKKKNEIDEAEEGRLRAQFSHYTDNIRAARDRANDLKAKFKQMGEKEAFKFLAGSLGYSLNPAKNLRL